MSEKVFNTIFRNLKIQCLSELQAHNLQRRIKAAEKDAQLEVSSSEDEWIYWFKGIHSLGGGFIN